jgi:hypothetical protein
VARIAMPTSSALAAAYGAARETLGPARGLGVEGLRSVGMENFYVCFTSSNGLRKDILNIYSIYDICLVGRFYP